ncbi:uncharacterized protein Z520_07067 [Fonsecaea multimorphosa CBS 102226]|uniref:Uncharacterized protein n=1 Tax=Fonsecaea multimorphosa CBS 102226 TaxID=1442371 RepID=A0A0D2KK42_9EURO|nr:uncharacterized protein Z520_07067 [Fonsecaea multimorphosa CBS 102226]KIX96953.1 hypothetical protein Z520_07067 [Fonsecaea multimorphosa CBS 102226]OAL23150.1 hypothetical protein AYO22_06643 [Fonsecaea multimorphosa]
MSTRGDDRSYKVVYSSRTRDEVDERIPARKPRRDYDYDDEYRVEKSYSRDYRDDGIEIDRRSRTSDTRTQLPPPVGATKTTYEIGRDRNAESYVKRSNAVIIDRPRDNGRYEYEILRPERRNDGAYVFDLDRRHSRDYQIDVDSRAYERPPRSRYGDPPLTVSKKVDDVLVSETTRGGGRDRTVRDVRYKDVQVTEEIDGDTRSSRRGRSSDAYVDDVAPPRRLRSAMRGRNNSPPSLMERRREHSVGFYRDQISHHDASEGRHERPGAEAHLAGRYLVGNGEFEDDVYAAAYTRRNRSRSRSRGRYGPQRSDPRLHEYDEEDDQRRTYTEETMRRYEYEDEQRPRYPPQRAHSRRRHHRHHHRGDDRDEDRDDDSYSEYEVVKRTTKEYYR